MFKIALIIFATATNVADNAPLTLQPETTINFEQKTEKLALSSCERVRKALVASGKTAFCGDVISAE